MPFSHSTATPAVNKKRKEVDDKVTVSHGDKKKWSYEEFEMALFKKEVELLDQRKENAELQQVIEKLRAKLDRCGADDENDDDDDDISDGDMSELNAGDPWVAKFLQLREFRMLQGHCNVPTSDPKMHNFVNNQRIAYSKKSGRTISDERIAMLDSLGFNWGKKYPTPVSWDARFAELAKFKTTMGHCNIQVSPKSPSPLAKWVSAQRSEYKRFRKGRDSLLNLEQIGQLKEIGFKWKAPRSP